MLKFVNQFFGDKNQREIDRKYQPVVDKILEATSAIRGLSDDDLRGQTKVYREQIRNAVGEIEARQQEINEALRLGHTQGDDEEYLTLDDRQDYFEELDELEEEWLEVAEETLDEILPRAFAVVKEVCRRLTERGSLRVRATDHDRAIRARRAYPNLQGSYAIWPNTWEAGGAQIQVGNDSIRRAATRRGRASSRKHRRDENGRRQDARGSCTSLPECAAWPWRAPDHGEPLSGAAGC